MRGLEFKAKDKSLKAKDYLTFGSGNPTTLPQLLP
jgi:hypothetical protein